MLSDCTLHQNGEFIHRHIHRHKTFGMEIIDILGQHLVSCDRKIDDLNQQFGNIIGYDTGNVHTDSLRLKEVMADVLRQIQGRRHGVDAFQPFSLLLPSLTFTPNTSPNYLRGPLPLLIIFEPRLGTVLSAVRPVVSARSAVPRRHFLRSILCVSA